jgi:hypothetical protein
MTVSQYEAEFAKLAKFAPALVADKENKVLSFHDGLRPQIKPGVLSFELTAYRTVVNKALLVEMGLNETQMERDNKQKKRPRQGGPSFNGQAKKQDRQHVDDKAQPRQIHLGKTSTRTLCKIEKFDHALNATLALLIGHL